MKALLLAIALAAAGAPSGSSAVTAGEFIGEPPTLIGLGFEWAIEGDDNRNAAVSAHYRRKGGKGWREALPLLRIGDERAEGARPAGPPLRTAPAGYFEIRLAVMLKLFSLKLTWNWISSPEIFPL